MTSRAPQRASLRRPSPDSSYALAGRGSAPRRPDAAVGLGSAGVQSAFGTTIASASASSAVVAGTGGGCRAPRQGAAAGVGRGGSAPRQHSLAPGVGQAEQEDRRRRSACEVMHARDRVADDERPQEDEDHLDVEGDEEQRVDVVRDAEPPVGVAVRVDAALVGEALERAALRAVADQPRRRRSSGRRTRRPRRRSRRRTRCLPSHLSAAGGPCVHGRCPLARREARVRRTHARDPGDRACAGIVAGEPADGAPDGRRRRPGASGIAELRRSSARDASTGCRSGSLSRTGRESTC